MERLFAISFFVILISVFLVGQETDSIKTYTLKQITVFGNKYSIDKTEFPVEKDNLSSVLELGGFNIIRKGVFLAQDIYADGLKRGDYTIVVDGERYHNACPMRMDAPLSRINPIEVESVEFVKSSANLQAGLGGTISINKFAPTDNFNLEGSLTQMFGKSDETDLSLFAEKVNHRISLRYTQGIPYKTGDGKTFKDLYGYKNNTKFQFGEASLYGVIDAWKYTGSIMYTEKVSFPYLQMDEIRSIVYNGSFSYEDHKLYFNYTDHLMNNDLRVSSMFMETDAKNFTVGMVSKYFEIYYRYWNADNRMNMANGSMSIYNNILPQINLYSTNLFHQISYLGFNLSGKVGLSYYYIGNKDVMNFYSAVYDNPKDKRVFPLLGVSISHSDLIGESLSFNNQFDIMAEAPEAEALYINIKRMMGKPYWSGNPNLDQPFRTTLRSNLSAANLSLDLFGSYIFNYVYMAAANVGKQKYQTFDNVNALIAGLNLRLNYEFIESEASYTYGENKTTKKPLLEILPLRISTRFTSPEFYSMKVYLKHTYENAQNRIDGSFLETPSGAWNTIDIGLIWKYSMLIVAVDLQNILDHNFSKHLSYLRDPFASGMRVIEPGTSVRVNVRYSY